MSYELRKPITEKERADFIVQYNHSQGLKIEDTEMFLFALLPNEIMGEKEIEIEVPDFEIVDIPVEIHDVDEEGNYIYDEEGNPVMHTETRPVQQQTGSHIETITVPYPVIDPEYEEKEVARLKVEKYEEAKTKAYVYLESGEALYEFEPNKHIEATDGNIGKFTAYALGFMAGSTTPVVWSTKEDETVLLNQEQVIDILQGLGAVQAQVWTVKFTDYVTAIKEASTIEEIEAVEIDYTLEEQ